MQILHVPRSLIQSNYVLQDSLSNVDRRYPEYLYQELTQQGTPRSVESIGRGDEERTKNVNAD